MHQACFVSFRNKVYFNGAFSPPTCAHAHIAATICSDPEAETGEPEETWVLTAATNVFRGMKFEDFEAKHHPFAKRKSHLNHPGPIIVFHATFPGCT